MAKPHWQPKPRGWIDLKEVSGYGGYIKEPPKPLPWWRRLFAWLSNSSGGEKP